MKPQKDHLVELTIKRNRKRKKIPFFLRDMDTVYNVLPTKCGQKSISFVLHDPEVINTVFREMQ